MLIANYSYVNQICGHNHSGITNPLYFISPHTMRGYFGKAQNDANIEQIKRDSFSTGTQTPYSYIMGDKGVLLSSTTTMNGIANIVSAISQGINIESALDGSGTITDAQLSLVVSLAASLSGDGTITTAQLVGITSLAASLSGTGDLTAGINVIAFMTTILEGSSELTADLKGTLSMAANIYVNESEATVVQLVDGVWNALAANYNDAGTMGNKLNSASAAGNPWEVDIDGSFTGDQAGKVLDDMQTAIATVKTLNLMKI